MGQILGAVGALPKIFIELEISCYLLKRLLGVRMEGDKKGARVSLDRRNVALKFVIVTVKYDLMTGTQIVEKRGAPG